MALPPGPWTPGIFNLLGWMADPTASFERAFREHGDLYTAKIPIYGTEVVVSHPDLVKQIFTGDPDVYNAGEANRTVAHVVGDRSVLVLDGREHRRERKLLMPPFHGERLGIYTDVMRGLTDDLIDALPLGSEVALLPHLQRLTFDVILHTVFGVSEGAAIAVLRDRLTELMDRGQSPQGMLYMMPAMQKDLGPLTGWAAFKRALAAADAAIYAVIAEARAAAAKATGPQRSDVLSLLLAAVDEEGQPMSDQELRDELITILIAGHETTATALAWAVDAIGRRPEVLGRILEEVRAAPEGAAHRAPLPYLDATIKEVLRQRPLASMVVRKTAGPVTLREHEIPVGTYLVVCVYNVQRHPDFWEAPDELRPERFLDRKIDPYAWLPFGGGARRCIGVAFALMEMRVVLATLFARVRLRLPDPPAKVGLRGFIFAPKGGGRVVVEERGARLRGGRNVLGEDEDA